jgi:predicted RNA polymerase sigma factor
LMVNSAPTIGLFPSWRYSTRRAARVSSDRDLILLEHQDR